MLENKKKDEEKLVVHAPRPPIPSPTPFMTLETSTQHFKTFLRLDETFCHLKDKIFKT